MSLDLEHRLRVFLASAPQRIHPIVTLEISHSAMSQVWHLWREPYVGTTTVDGVVKNMIPSNIDIKLAGSKGDLDQEYQINLDLADQFDTFREQMDRIPLATAEKVKAVYREFLSDALDDPQAQSTLQVESVSWAIGMASITAISPRLSTLRTGEIYNPREIPMLRAFL